MMQMRAARLAGLLLLAEHVAAVAVHGPFVLAMPAGSRHLFVDDTLIERFTGGVGIRQNSPLRVTTDKPVLVADAPWEKGCLVYWFSSALRAYDNPAELRYYYYLLCPRHGWASGVPRTNCSAHTACGLNDTSWDTFLSLAVSTDDGDTFTKPMLNQVEWRNSTANNIVIRGPTDGSQMEGGDVWIDPLAPPPERYRNQAKCVNCAPDKDRTIAQWYSADGIVWHERLGWQPKPGRLDNQEVIFWDEDVAFNGSRGAYSLITRAPTQNDISTQPLAIRRFLSKDPFNCSSAMRHPDNESCWRDGTVLGGTVPDALDDSTHPRSATPGANQSWDTWPVEFGSGQVWKVEKTFPPTYILFAEMHWLWMMTCWKHAPGCQDPSKPWQSQNGCVNLPAEEPCQPVDVRLAVSRDGVTFARQNNTPPTEHGARCTGMCDPEARRALISVGMAGTWMSRSVWANPNPILSRSGTELRLFFNGRNVDNRNRIDPQGAPGFDTSPVIEGAGYAALRPDGLFGLRAAYGEAGRGEVVTKPLYSCGRAAAAGSIGRWTPVSSATGGVCHGQAPHGWGWAKELLLNMDSGIGGELRCELQDANGRPLPGFTLNQSIPMTRNSLRARVAWAGDTPLSSLEPTQPLRVRFVMEDTWLFSFQFV